MITVKYEEPSLLDELCGSTDCIDMKNIHQILSDENHIKQIARLLIADHVESFLYVVSDMKDPPKTFKETTQYLEGVKTSLVSGYLPNLIFEFQESLLQAIADVKVDVKTVELSSNGLEDAKIEIQ